MTTTPPPTFQKYYSHLLGPEEYTKLDAYLQTPLPLTFRISNMLTETQKQKLLTQIHTYATPTKKLECYTCPEITKQSLKKDEKHKALHKFLIAMTESGYTTRQECVSMIPSVVLQAEKGMNILDMCAAPGMKTSQIVEDCGQSGDGIVVANDADNKRAYMLVHTLKRFSSPNVIVTNHDASAFPNIYKGDKDGKKEQVLFDRILADVPCSGDGTMRKNPQALSNWTMGNAIGLHSLQLRIASRGVDMLKPGGRMVYSTCSMNPVENEAVVGELLAKYPSLRLVDASSLVPGLVYKSGVTEWSILHQGEIIDSLPDDKKIISTMFPAKDISKYNMERCMRLYPHLQNTGGFFVAVLEKVPSSAQPTFSKADEQAENTVELPEKELNPPTSTIDNIDQLSSTTQIQGQKRGAPELCPKRGKRVFTEDPFIFLDADSQELNKIGNFFGFTSELSRTNFLVRCADGRFKQIYYVCNQIREILQSPWSSSLKVINTGVKMFVKSDSVKDESCSWRLTMEMMTMLERGIFTDQRIIDISLEDMLLGLTSEYPLISELSATLQSALAKLSKGGCIFRYKMPAFTPRSEEEFIYLPIWVAPMSINVLCDVREKFSVIFSVDPVAATTFQKSSNEKAEVKRVERQTRENQIKADKKAEKLLKKEQKKAEADQSHKSLQEVKSEEAIEVRGEQ